MTPFNWACYYGHIEIVLDFIKAGILASIALVSQILNDII
jgi:hypothetical protein